MSAPADDDITLERLIFPRRPRAGSAAPFVLVGHCSFYRTRARIVFVRMSTRSARSIGHTLEGSPRAAHRLARGLFRTSAARWRSARASHWACYAGHGTAGPRWSGLDDAPIEGVAGCRQSSCRHYARSGASESFCHDGTIRSCHARSGRSTTCGRSLARISRPIIWRRIARWPRDIRGAAASTGSIWIILRSSRGDSRGASSG